MLADERMAGALLFKQASPINPPAPRRSLWEVFTEEKIRGAELVVARWDLEGSGSDHLFPDRREEVRRFVVFLRELQDPMHRLVKEDPHSELLVRAQSLMEASMKRLAKEFRCLLSTNLHFGMDVDESVSSFLSRESMSARSRISVHSEGDSKVKDRKPEDYDRQGSTIKFADLRMIADCMIVSGYAKECISTYKIVRKWMVEEDLYRNGLERPVIPSQIRKMEWEALEEKIKMWLNAIKVAMKTVFPRERILCDAIFSTSDSLKRSCFADITKDVATTLFVFTGAASRGKKSPEKIFRVLDMYEAIANLWLEIETTFSSDSTSAVQLQAADSLINLGEAVRSMLRDFEMAIQKDSSKSAVPGPGGSVHPLTRYVMNYLVFLGDYSELLMHIVADWPLDLHGSLPKPLSCLVSEEFEEGGARSAISKRFVWFILLLLCKLDAKAQLYKDGALSYLFLANNLRYVVAKVTKTSLRHVLGGDWIVMHDAKVGEYTSKYKRIGWAKFLSSLSEKPSAEIGPDQARGQTGGFSAAFDPKGVGVAGQKALAGGGGGGVD